MQELLLGLPTVKRQPNLVFAAARWHGAPTDPSLTTDYEPLREVLIKQWPAVRETILTRSTQTNEVGRSATLLPVLAGLPGPLALIEVGASAGLCLHPDRWSYRYLNDKGEELARLDPTAGVSPVVLECAVSGPVPLPSSLPEVVYRGGVDLNPLDLREPEAARWLELLVWPEHEDRRERLAAASRIAAQESVNLLRADLLAGLDRAVTRAREAAPEATLVIFHSAVIVYLAEHDRQRWSRVVGEVVQGVRSGGGRAHWISNEGPQVLPEVSETAPTPAQGVEFCLALDGQAKGWTHGHGRYLRWC